MVRDVVVETAEMGVGRVVCERQGSQLDCAEFVFTSILTCVASCYTQGQQNIYMDNKVNQVQIKIKRQYLW
jgi:hypothetical protein